MTDNYGIELAKVGDRVLVQEAGTTLTQSLTDVTVQDNQVLFHIGKDLYNVKGSQIGGKKRILKRIDT